MDIRHAINESKKQLINTPEFAGLKSAIIALRKNPNANALVQQFQKKEESVYASYNSGAGQAANKLFEELNQDYERLTTIPEISNYFNASENFNMLLSNYMRELNQSLQQELQ